MKPLRLSIPCLSAYPALTGGREMFGGGERHAVLLCREFARRGHDVSLMTLDPGPGKPLERDGVRVVPAYARKQGIPGLRFWLTRLPHTLRAYGRANPEFIIQPIQSPLTGITAWYAQRAGIPWIHMITSDQGVNGTWERNVTLRDRWFYRYGMRRATAIVAQTHHQKRELENHYERTATVIRNPTEPVDPGEAQGRYVVWVGQLFPIKRPELLLEIANRIPDVRFKVAGTNTGKLAPELVQALEKAPNLELLGQVASQDMSDLYHGGGVFLSTSKWEGLSNAFLEAWQHGLPVCSLAADPDGIIAERAGTDRSLGVVEPDLGRMADLLHRLIIKAPEERRAMGQSGREYVRDNHDPGVVLDQWEAVMDGCLRAPAVLQ